MDRTLGMYANLMAALYNGMRVNREGHRLYFHNEAAFDAQDFIAVSEEERRRRVFGTQSVEEKKAMLAIALTTARVVDPQKARGLIHD